MNLLIILEFPWLKKWKLEATLCIEPNQWCWFDHKYISGCFADEGSVAERLGIKSNTAWFDFDVSILCLTFILEGIKQPIS